MIDPARSHYARYGTKAEGRPTLLLIHGAGGASTVWPDVLLGLKTCQTVLLDLPGHGRSPQPGRRTISHYADAVTRFIDSQSLSNVLIGGHSMGGAVALELARRELPNLRGLVLIGSSSRLRVGLPLFATLSNDFNQAADMISEWSFAKDAPPGLRQQATESMRVCGSLVTTGDFLACNHFDVTADLEQMALPALIISGTADRMVPHRHSAKTAAAMPQATFQALEGVGHYPMQEKSATVARLIEAFVGSV